jgi:hypothetical protein
MMYAPVSRAAVHKRLKEGKMTAFCFHVVEAKRSIFVYQKKLKQLPYVYIPVSECKAWGEERVAPVSLCSGKIPHPGWISAVPRGRAQETGREQERVSQPQPTAAMACS